MSDRIHLAAAVLLLLASPVQAHKIHVFAVAQGKELTGNVYAADDSPIRNAKVTVFDAAGSRMGETTTNENGEFRFPIGRRTDYRVVADSGEGHAAEYTVKTDEIAAEVPAGSGGSMEADGARGKATAEADGTRRVPATVADGTRRVPATLEAKVEEVREQVVQLRLQIDRYEQRTRVRDVLGGVGVIVGVTGLWFFLAARRARAKGA